MDGQLFCSVNSRAHAKVYKVDKVDGQVTEKVLKTYSGSYLCDTRQKSYNPFWTKLLVITGVPHQAEIRCIILG
jgi:hypothetical protein